MSEFKPFQPRDLGRYTDVDVKVKNCSLHGGQNMRYDILRDIWVCPICHDRPPPLPSSPASGPAKYGCFGRLENPKYVGPRECRYEGRQKDPKCEGCSLANEDKNA